MFHPSPCVGSRTAEASDASDFAVEDTQIQPTKNSGQGPQERVNIGICLASPVNGRLVEGVAAQLGLSPIFISAEDLRRPELLSTIEMLIVDEAVARDFYSSLRNFEAQSPALVAVVDPPAADADPAPPQRDGRSFDGLLTLPMQPAMLLTQLGVILYAHRTHVNRYVSAMEELNLNRRIFRSVTSGISVADATKPDFPLIYVNPAFEVMTGYSLEDVAGRNCRFLQGTDRDQPGLVLVREALHAKRETVAILRNYRRNGEPFWNELSLSPIRDKDGNVTHVVGIQNDVTSRVAFEEALRESEKLATAGRLAASIAHEINNPLEAVTNLLYLARLELHNPEQAAEYLTTADLELRRVSLLTAQSLRFYKQSTKPQIVRPADLVASVLDVYSTKLINNGVELQKRDRTSESIVCLESEIRQVISNLVRNALDAMAATGGRLLVRTREATEWRTAVRGVAITIADTGVGMATETISQIYTAFYTTKGISGTGLGLWVSSEIVARHHGRLLVRSRQGPDRHGTVFVLFVPYQAIAA